MNSGKSAEVPTASLSADAEALRSKIQQARDAALQIREGKHAGTIPSPKLGDCLLLWATALGHYEVAVAFYHLGDIERADYHMSQGDLFKELAEDCWERRAGTPMG